MWTTRILMLLAFVGPALPAAEQESAAPTSVASDRRRPTATPGERKGSVRHYSVVRPFADSRKVFAIRGARGDLWADKVLGQRDFTEITAREVVDYRVHNPGGVAIDGRQSTGLELGLAWVWDSSNNRIIGFDVAACYRHSICRARRVIGQPATCDWGSCNRDGSFQGFPERAPATAATLCGQREGTGTTLEEKTFTSLFVDQRTGDLYVADVFNHRVLRYGDPWNGDQVADGVWGQASYSENLCNRGRDEPSADSLCFVHFGTFGMLTQNGAGVTLDATGDLWVADGGNNRVLRFPPDGTSANLVLGQPWFTTRTSGNGAARLSGPGAVRIDRDGTVFVADTFNNRVLAYCPPFFNGMDASRVVVDFEGWEGHANGLEIDPEGTNIWTYGSFVGWSGKLARFSAECSRCNPADAEVVLTLPHRGGGSVGIDRDGNLLASMYVCGQDVQRFQKKNRREYSAAGTLLNADGYNATSKQRLEISAWPGVAVLSTRAARQLAIADGRLLFWDLPEGLLGVSNGEPATGCVWPVECRRPEAGEKRYGQLVTSAANATTQLLWATWSFPGSQEEGEIHVFQAPLVAGMKPLKRLSRLPVLGGGVVSLVGPAGVAVTPDSAFLWVSEPARNRVLRVRDPLKSPIIDVVLGQVSLSSASCNRGGTPGPQADLDNFCRPGAVSLDRKGNLYVSDHFIENEGNFRLLMFHASIFPQSPRNVLFGLGASKSFTPVSGVNQSTFQVAFDSYNRMVADINPYAGGYDPDNELARFANYYNHPALAGSVTPDGRLKDYTVWGYAVAFDAEDNLIIYEGNRGQVRIYDRPFRRPP
jgi:sugar lactone lactonase YvrE